MNKFFKASFTKKIVLLFLDVVFASAFLFFSLFLSRGREAFSLYLPVLVFLAVSTVVLPLFSYINASHRIIWQHSGVMDVARLTLSIFSAYAFSVLLVCLYYKIFVFTSLEWISAMVFTAVASVTLRMLVRRITRRQARKEKAENLDKDSAADYGNTMIIGGGNAAEILLREIFTAASFSKCTPLVIVDDNKKLHGLSVRGVPIEGDRDDIEKLCKRYKIKTIFFAIPSISPEEKRQILKICSNTGCVTRVIPGINEMVETPGAGLKIRKVEITDLLGRDPINLNDERVLSYVKDKTVMVTGGGGSIGSELCRQIARHSPKRLIIFDIYENSTYDIQNELKRKNPDLDLVCLIGSVRDVKRLEGVFDELRPDIVYHAAAHKHVPLMEDSPNEAVKNNVFGTLNTVRAADKFGVSRFVLISTDKAVNPTNIMGATKRICEMIVQTSPAL